MAKQHLKRLTAPRSWRIERKAHTWVVRPKPGGHRLKDSIPLLHVVRDILGYADNYREANRILKEGQILVDGKIVKDPKRGVGLLDIIEIPKTKERYTVIVDTHGTLTLKSIRATEAKFKLLSLVNKTIVKGGVVQLNFHDGRNILVEGKKSTGYGVHDTFQINLKDNSIKEHVKYETGALAFVIRGAHRGEVATIKEINKTRSPMPNVVTLEKEGSEFRTVEDYIFMVGREKPLISVMK
jgi:small subunit ribosomal protein S4e